MSKKHAKTFEETLVDTLDRSTRVTNTTLNGENTTYFSKLLPYPIDISKLIDASKFTLNKQGVPYQHDKACYDPATISQYALLNWDKYVATNEGQYRDAFLAQTEWLLQHAVRLPNNASGWPISSLRSEVLGKKSWLSAIVQGNALSVLVRAFVLTGQNSFLELAQCVVRSFQNDVLVGGISTPVGASGIFFEEPATYPATHNLIGCMLALFGLYEYASLMHDSEVTTLIERCHQAIHVLLSEYDTGFGTRVNLLSRELASPTEGLLQAELLHVHALFSECSECRRVALRWKNYRHNRASRLRYAVTSKIVTGKATLWKRIQNTFFPKQKNMGLLTVNVPVHSFPVTGGIRAVLAAVAQVTADVWNLDYFTHRKGANSESFTIHTFGSPNMSPWQFPMVWLYFASGFGRLLLLIKQGADYSILFPQDAVFTGAFAGLVGKLTGRRVVCIDHGSLSLLNSKIYRSERLQALAGKHRLRRYLDPLLFKLYWPSVQFFAKLSALSIDHFLIPGVVGDGIDDVCIRLGIPQSRITRFASMIDLSSYPPSQAETPAVHAKSSAIPADAIVVSIVCRLAPEKGLGIAIAALGQVLATLPPEVRQRVQVIIAGDGPSRQQVEQDVQRQNLQQTCVFWGETSHAEVISLLKRSDVFLYTSTRGACFSMAILEAMATSCAVVASTLPLSNKTLLAGGRGIAVPPGDVAETASALERLLHNVELCHRMGALARDYVAREHSSTTFKQVLMRATYWSELDGLLRIESEQS